MASLTTTATPYGTIRANSTDYDSGIQLERFGAGGWGVPAWDEEGLPDLKGPFLTIQAAASALCRLQLEGAL